MAHRSPRVRLVDICEEIFGIGELTKQTRIERSEIRDGSRYATSTVPEFTSSNSGYVSQARRPNQFS
jgi:hypothetical protein